ncbi:methionine ABC transporter permease [Streptobacillus moniliformis]|uniref:Binding-protein-dependent transport systems inner membrane component n=1 Tax=Streptobacillus moniliformis (strain ATCC 14647 / DSM 12112 / NCTC 10651 / 9901) TaxID=519441 RepID=D1AXS8_STRM9|nr:methionine ABC transporter permease [Streptobacillus moniliformis]ACZ01104.1 binding-protein-dependent transport systems inner membrane component [Streptobacillus moniliformis DSM 12112]AVL42530.1 ABC transporter permease [Streptobacillus moniliformis]SQA13754.1 Methionine import system permease protein MetP [Streptobacillus moniliformis]
MIIKSIFETIYMISVAIIIASIIGFPLGILLSITKEGSISENKTLNKILDLVIVNITRSIPFVILIVLLIPLSRLIVGKSYGTTAFIIPLSIGTAPFVARIIENSLNEVSYGLIEAAISMGATNKDIVFKVLIPEAIPSIINGLTLTLISLVGFSAIAGIIGGGGLGNLAVIEGFQRGNYKLMYLSTFILIIIVQIIQFIGTKIVKYIEKKRGR